MKTTKHKYDIVILGAGCSGMLLSFFLSNKKTKHKKKILLIEKNQSFVFDKNWCFWEEDSFNTFSDCRNNSWNNWVLCNDHEDLLKYSKTLYTFENMIMVVNRDFPRDYMEQII